VGAVDLNGTATPKDDTVAPWSAYGYTYDGFKKPELSAAGRYMVGPVPMNSTLAAQRADKIVAPGYIQLSGTSFAAPVVAGAAAELVARHPTWTPDQIKGALMVTARPVVKSDPGAAGVGEVTVAKAAAYLDPPNPNKALERYVVGDPTGSAVPVFDAVGWDDAAKSDSSWDATTWAQPAWQDAGWDPSVWAAISWDDVSVSDVSISDVSISDVSINDVSVEDAAEGDANDAGGYALDSAEQQAVLADPDLAPPTDVLPSPDTTSTAP
jgi:subtilisin family serine protease